jgi:hypothetical protein
MEKKFHGAQRGGREDYSSAGESTRVATSPCRRLYGIHFVSNAAIGGATQRFDVNNPRFRKHLGSVFLSQI